MTAPLGVRHPGEMSLDPVETNPENYQVVFENDRVRVLEYHDVQARARAPTGTRQRDVARCSPARAKALDR